MRVISKHISLEDFTSRLPGVAPAYVPGSKNPIFFDEESLKKRKYEYPSNYGLVPMSVKTSKGCLSWETISDWYHFFTDYYHLLNDWGHCGVKYDRALDYYTNESKNGYADQMKYGSDKQTYIDLDTTFNERGGENMYKLICDELVPTMSIPSGYTDYWHTTKLFYPDFIKWRGWFNDRYAKYSGYTEAGECSNSKDCCDCAEYFGRGGNDMYSAFTKTSFTIPTNTSGFSSGSFITDISLQVSIDDMGEFSIFSDEYTVGKDYRTADGYGKTQNICGGTVSAINGRAMTLKNSTSEVYRGFKFDPEYMELEEDPSQWKTHSGDTTIWFCEKCGYTATTLFAQCPKCGSNKIHEVTEENNDIRYIFSATPTGYYGFRPEFTKVTCSTTEDVRKALAESYDVMPLNAVNVNGALYNVSSEEYGYYKGNTNKLFYVYREEYTETPYTVINGKRIYADARPQSSKVFVCKNCCHSATTEFITCPECGSKKVICVPDKYYYFPFFYSNSVSSSTMCDTQLFNPANYKWFPRTKECIADTINFIIYGGGTYEVVDSGVTINGYDYKWLQGRFSDEDEELYVGKDNKVYEVAYNAELEENSGYTYSASTSTATKTVNEEADVYQYGMISGTGISKLNTLRCNSMLTDDTGESIEGRYNVSGKTTHQPPEGTELDLMYEKYNIGRMYPIEDTNSLYYGDMITDMNFYYLTYGGDKVVESGWSGSSLETIQSLEIPSAYTDSVDSGTVYCDIDYVIGGTFIPSAHTMSAKTEEGTVDLNVGNTYTLAGSGYSSGVTYHETVKFVRTETQYKLSLGVDGQIPTTRNAASSHTLCYPVVCYKLEQDNELLNSDYGGRYSYPVADFEMELPPTSGWSGYGRDTELFPVFRQEYLFGSATMQKLDVDIYIDRGTNAAFEKHLKLGEVTSMEALEQLGNGYFKMMDN
jgi:Zn finger protein HypA/HybF involved in hydrogenase expression